MALRDFQRGYKACALFSSHGSAGDEFLDQTYTIDDVSLSTQKRMEWTCKAFYDAHHDRWNMCDDERAGEYFWYTRNRHGIGFWDGELVEETTGKELTEAAHAFGECDLYVGDDSKIYQSG